MRRSEGKTMNRNVTEVLSNLVIRLAIESDKRNQIVTEQQLMDYIADNGIVVHDSPKMARIIINAAYSQAIDDDNDILAGMIAETFVDNNGFPIIMSVA